MSIPFELKQVIESGNAILFVGAGIGFNMKSSKGENAPTGAKLAEYLSLQFDVPSNGETDLAKISQFIVAQKGGKQELNTFLRDFFDDFTPDEYMLWIPTIRWKAIFTTNYDCCIQKAYDYCTHPAQQYITVTHLSGLPDFMSLQDVPIIHLHGSLFTDNSPDILITQQDYVRYKNKRNSLFEFLKLNMATSCILYVGYSHNDPNFSAIIDDLETELYPDTPKKAFRIDPNTDDLDSYLLEKRNIITIKEEFSEFVGDALTTIKCSYTKDADIKLYQKNIYPDFLDAFNINANGAIRFFHEWKYVNQLSTNTGIGIDKYLRGEKPDWNIIFSNLYFHRNIEDDIYDTLIDYVTEPKRHVQVCIVLGSAGYGITTILMSLAKRLVNDRAAEVFYHAETSELKLGDIDFACDHSPDTKHVFFIDNAANFARSIRGIIKHAGERHDNCTLVLGERTNEWLQCNISLKAEVHTILPLDDVEIENLLDYLSSNHELNRLSDLSREQQFAAIKKNYSRELLVAIREATEGRSFDAIIEDEYHNIADAFSRNAYALISCFHQHNALLRVELLARLLGTSLIEFYDKTRNTLVGVISYEDIVDGTTEIGVRTRHRIIANLVWNRCLSSAEKDSILHDALSCLNLAYRLDKKAFDSFIYSDQMIDSLSSDESKIRFFDRACQMEPDNPYVRQHYARMLARINRLSTASMIIDKALEMDPANNMLHHTRGYILQRMALVADSADIGRRFLGQSENEYETALRISNSDAYFYQGLAALYLGWAKRADISSEESSLYLSKAEETIERGLKNARNKEAIWIVSSELDKYIGNMPNRLTALQQAVSEAPTSTLPKYLLAKAHIEDHAYSEARILLEGIVFQDPNHYKAMMEYAKTILFIENDIKQAIAVLLQSTLYGYSDYRFNAMLGGLLFLDGRFSEAESVFSESGRRGLFNANNYAFYPSEYNIISDMLDGIVMHVGYSYSQIKISSLPHIRCASTKINGQLLKVGQKVKCSISFTAKRAMAIITEM